MDLTGRPLLDTAPDHELFAGRDGELARLADWVEHGRNVLLIGERGSGKTTLLRQLAYELRRRHPRTPPAFVEGRLVTDARVLLELVRRRLGVRPPERAAWPPSASVDGQAPGEAIDLADLVRGLREAGPRRRRVILVDEPPTSASQTLFGRLRDELWQLPFSWGVAASEGDAGVYLTPPADAFFDDALRLIFHPYGDASHAVAQGVKRNDAGVFDSSASPPGDAPVGNLFGNLGFKFLSFTSDIDAPLKMLVIHLADLFDAVHKARKLLELSPLVVGDIYRDIYVS